jgi:hypothetical protein
LRRRQGEVGVSTAAGVDVTIEGRPSQMRGLIGMLNVECSDGDGDDGNDWNNEGAEQYIFGIVVFNLSREGEGDGCGGLKVEWQAEALF